MNSKKNPYECLIMKILVYGIYESTAMAICLAISIYGFKMVCRGDFFGIMLIIMAFIMCMSAFAVFAGEWVSEAYKAITRKFVQWRNSSKYTGGSL